MLDEKNLVAQINNVTFETLSNEAIERMKTILLHNLFLGRIGRKKKEFKGVSSFFSNDTKLDRIFKEAVAMSLPTLEDFYGANHFGPLLIPNALYHGVESKITGKKLLTAIAVGFLLGISLCDQIGEKISEKGFRGTSILGTIAAAATAAFISKGSEQEILYTLAHASANTFGISSSLLAGSNEWKYQAGLGAFHAAFANLLATNGEAGNLQFLTCKNGFLDVFSNKRTTNISFEPSKLLQIGVKRDPVHIFVLSPVAAAKELFKRFGPFLPNEMNKIIIKISPKQLSAINLQKGPYENTNQANISTYTNVALTLLYGYTYQECKGVANHQEVHKMKEKMEIVSDENLNEYESEIVIVSEISEEKILITDQTVKDLYFPTFQKEKEQLIEEANKWGVSTHYVEKLSVEINRLTESDSITNLIELYEVD